MFAYYIHAFCWFTSPALLHNAMRKFGTFFLGHPVYAYVGAPKFVSSSPKIHCPPPQKKNCGWYMPAPFFSHMFHRSGLLCVFHPCILVHVLHSRVLHALPRFPLPRFQSHLAAFWRPHMNVDNLSPFFSAQSCSYGVPVHCCTSSIAILYLVIVRFSIDGQGVGVNLLKNYNKGLLITVFNGEMNTLIA